MRMNGILFIHSSLDAIEEEFLLNSNAKSIDSLTHSG